VKLHNAITDVPGILVGHADDAQALTGCTVVLCEKGAVAGIDQRGGAPGTRETDLLHPMHLVQKVHAVLLAGGSAFGLDAASGVVRYLEERRIGFNVRVARVPIVPAAILFDLGVGRADVRPDAAMGYAACRQASSQPPSQGNAGAGMGATIGKLLGMGGAMKGGIGTASVDAGGGVVVGALAAVNSLGDVVDPATGAVLAGLRPVRVGPIRLGGSGPFADTLKIMRGLAGRAVLRYALRGNTVIAVVATNGRLTKQMPRPRSGRAADAVASAVVRAVEAHGVMGVPARREVWRRAASDHRQSPFGGGTMFRKKDEVQGRDEGPERVDSVFGADLTWKGEIGGRGGLLIEGAFEGEITLNGLIVVGEQGRVVCRTLKANTVVVAGSVRGDITARRVEITRTGRVWGDVVAEAFSTEEGAFLRGQITMEERVDLGLPQEQGKDSE
jgi:L-aminopeptidase/D-esterase-like protein/cytoskeletal protein CcmA (bactofilin family)